MQDARRQLREIGLLAGLAICLAVESVFAGTSGVQRPLVFENRFLLPAAAKAEPKAPAAQPPTAKEPISVIEALLAPATAAFKDEATSETQPAEDPPPADGTPTRAEQEPKPRAEPESKPHAEQVAKPQAEPESKPRAEPESKPHAEPVAKPPTETQAESAAEPVAESAVVPSKSDVTPPPAPALPPIQPATPPMETDVRPIEAPSVPWQPQPTPSDAWKPKAEIRPLKAQPPDELHDEMESVWSNESETQPELPHKPDPPQAAPPQAAAPPQVVPPQAAVSPQPAVSPQTAGGPMPYSPTVAELSIQLLPSVQKAYGLAQHGAVYAAQTEFIQVLRRIAQAKDAAEGVDKHSRSLAVGLRALDEADDFMPQGAQLEGEMDVSAVASSHRTPVLNGHTATVRPDEAIALYHQFAREQLAHAVAGEQAGSMALFGLGKVQKRLAYESEGELRHERKALVMFEAALDAGPGNHLAANEIGVLLARGGQPVEAAEMFRRAIDIAPSSTCYHNLAVVERKLGQQEQAAANEQYAQYLAIQDRAAGAVSRRNGVAWVSPQDLSRVAQPMPTPAQEERVVNDPRQAPQPARLPAASGPVQTVARWPQTLVPGVFRH